jgi:class 3 adenylate cyclase/tetratricopeptide (TPR) repeat protein
LETASDVEKLKQAISALEAQRQSLGDEVVETALAPMRAKLAGLQAGEQGEQRKLVSVLFADLAGFTSLASGMDAEDLQEVINAYFQRWTACIKRQGGMVEKYIGDAVLAVFGLPSAHEDDPERAIRAALDMQQELKQLNEGFERDHRLRLSMRVGINTGEVVVSLTGERGGEEFVVIGDTVNLASRLQAAAPPDGILISHATYRHVRGLFETSSFGPLELKGVSQPVQAYWIKAAKPRAFPLASRGVEGVETRMVGRQEEFKRLQVAFYKATQANTVHGVTLVGEAGVGKSRLLHEFEQWLDLSPERVFYLRGRAHHSSQFAPYSLIRDLLAFRFQVQDSDPPAVVRTKVEQAIGEAQKEDSEYQMRAHWLARLLGFEIGASEHLHGIEADARALHDRALVYLGDYFRALGTTNPVVVLLEDLHWADDSSLDLINRLQSALAKGPFFILAAARRSLFERRQDWGEGLSWHTRIDLNPLSKVESQALVAAILEKVQPLPVGLRDLVVNTAEGNPFYIEELIKMLIEDGVIVKGQERWIVEQDHLGQLRIPTTLVGVLQARLDSLKPEQRTYLQCGAVIGRLFWDKAVDKLRAAGEDENSLPPLEASQILDTLRSREMIYRQDQSTFQDMAEYLFKHALLRDVTYSSLLKRQRRVYHGLAASWLEEVTGRKQRSGEFSMLIAEHYEAAGQPEQAAQWYLSAGRTAAARFANQEALRALSKALELAPQPDAGWKFTVLLELDKVYDLLGNRTDQIPNLAALEAAAEQSGDSTLMATAALRQAKFAFQTAAYPAAIEHAQRAEELAQQSDNKELAARSSLSQAETLIRQGEFSQAGLHARRALTLAGEQGITGIEAEGYRSLGLVAFFKGDFPLARSNFTQALELFQQAGDRRGEGMAINNLGGATFDMGEYNEARNYYSRSLELCRSIGDRTGEGRALNNLGIVAVTQADFSQAEVYYQQGLEIIREIGHRSHESSALDNLGILALYRYQYSLAEKYLLQSLALSQQIGDRVSERNAMTNLTRLYLTVGEYEAAWDFFQAVKNTTQDISDMQGYCIFQINLSQYLFLTGDLQAALHTSQETLRLATENDLRSEQAWAENLLAADLYGLKRISEALPHYQQAYQIHQELDEFNEAIGALAGLARTQLVLGDQDEAHKNVETILAHFEARGVEGLEAPEQIFLDCYQVLAAVQDPRAGDLLKRAYHFIQEVSSKIESTSMRSSYLERVPANRAILAAWTEAGATG